MKGTALGKNILYGQIGACLFLILTVLYTNYYTVLPEIVNTLFGRIHNLAMIPVLGFLLFSFGYGLFKLLVKRGYNLTNVLIAILGGISVGWVLKEFILQ
ncbi:hypothetical protein FAZ19_04965 [Sphingobacterium alkalisoli]|uniref:Uncharacterized protein n=1 Tax=Sphingobacterium alkalisoli TaxID=1874115 RepID=A0A4V5LZ21_9SPHI|nr:hypothetical protein [Sphingobacterium alkalisoli]TJY68609.1 hypothetical protein FAZ19_04965 [Sphingobacterium alkalisoli]GGH05335.1 hypothetical protein GCM10011418_01440 [Sphingobacterium alkalisoli]